jgi:hypothetical protein
MFPLFPDGELLIFSRTNVPSGTDFTGWSSVVGASP